MVFGISCRYGVGHVYRVDENWLWQTASTKLEGTADRIKGKVQETLGRLEAKEAELESGMTTRRDDDIGKI